MLSTHKSARARRAGLLAAVGTCAWLIASSADAASFVVSTTSDGGIGSLRQAILDANASAGADTITFAAGGRGTITLASQLPDITGSLSIDGGYYGAVTIDGNNLFRAFSVSGPITVSLSNLRIQNVRATGTRGANAPGGGNGADAGGGGGGGGLGAGAGLLLGSGNPGVTITTLGFDTAAVVGGAGGNGTRGGPNQGGDGGLATEVSGSEGGLGGVPAVRPASAGVLGGGGGGGNDGTAGANGNGGGGGGSGGGISGGAPSSFLGGAGGGGGAPGSGGGGGGGAGGPAIFAFSGSLTIVSSGAINLTAAGGAGGSGSGTGSNGSAGTGNATAVFVAPAGGVTVTGSLGSSLPAVALPPAPVPTLTEWAMIGLSGLLALFGAAVVSRRRFGLPTAV